MLTPWLLWAQVPTALSTSVSVDQRGNAVVTTEGNGAPTHQPSRVLVRFRNGSQSDFLAGTPSARVFLGDPNLFLVENPPGLSVAQAVQNCRAKSSVLYAEPDYVVEGIATPADPLWNQQWDMVKISAPAAWDRQMPATWWWP